MSSQSVTETRPDRLPRFWGARSHGDPDRLEAQRGRRLEQCPVCVFAPYRVSGVFGGPFWFATLGEAEAAYRAKRAEKEATA